MQKLTLLIAASLLATSGTADELKEFEFEAPGASAEKVGPAFCEFDDLTLPDNLVVYAAGGYSGRKLDFQIDRSGHTATQFDIAINSPRQPVALILGAYEPTIWNLGWTRGTYVVAVLASGYHRQAIAGLPSDVPVLISTHDNSGPCGYLRVNEKRNTALNPMSRKLFGRPVKLVYPGTRNGKIKIGDPMPADARMVTSADNPPEFYHDKAAPLAGLKGLEEAVRKGILRPATNADADAWVAAQTAQSPDADVPPVAGRGVPKTARPRMFRAYVVLKPFTYPTGLYGGNSATFFIAKGVPRPEGNPGHSPVFDFNMMACSGATCPR